MLLKSLTYFLLSKIPFSLISINLRVLAYHTVTNSHIFEKQIQYLEKTYNIISLEHLNLFLKGNKQLPKNPLLITFDDGDFSVYKNGFSVLKEHKVPAVIFVISTLIDTNKTFWCRWVEEVYQQEDKTYAAARKEVNRLKKIPNTEREIALKKLSPVHSRQLNLKELYELEDAGIVIANHTHTHPMIDQCSKEEVVIEMDKVKSHFDKWDINGYSYFAYPNGNIDENAERILIEKGIKMAFLFDHKVNSKNINPMRISRIRVNADADLDEFKVKVSGLHSKLMRLKNNFLK